jgi:hypothetical protein
MAEGFSLGDPEFFSPRMIREYCEKGRRMIRPLYHELHVSAEELEMVLRDVTSANPQLFGQDSKIRAKIVSGHLRRAADSVEVAAGSLARTYQSACKHYFAEIESHRKPRRKFDMTDQ